jgi:VanZ family protein
MKLPAFVRYWMPAIVWMAIIFLGSTDMLSAEHTSRFLVPFLRWFDPQISFATLNAIQFGIRKLGHLTEYAILAMLLWRALRGTLASTRNLAIASLVFMVSALFAASDEFHQSFIPTRTSSAHDVMIDCLGALVAVSICALLALRRNAPRTAS